MAGVVTCTRCGLQQAATSTYCMQCGSPLPGMGTGMLPLNTVLQGRYVILDKLGQGGFGAVYRVGDLRLAGSSWAVKEMSDAAIVDPLEKARAVAVFQQEAQLLAQLAHPNIPKVTDYFTEYNKHYIVMEFVPGETLQDRLARQNTPCSEPEVRLWASQLCDVLAYLHGQYPPIIFRDLKPANIMLTPQGQVKLIDFGIARLFKPGKSTDTQVVGTPGFASPEQYGRGQTDARSDVYSLGVVLHHLLTLHDPATTPFAMPPLSHLRRGVSPQMEQIVARATQPIAANRFRDVGEMRQALDGGVAGPPAPTPAPAAPRAGRGVPIWLLLVLLTAGLGAGAVIAGGLLDGDTPAPPAIVVPTLPPSVAEAPTAAPTQSAAATPADTPPAGAAPTALSPAADAPPTALSPAAEPPREITLTPDWDAQRAAIVNVVDYYGSDVKIDATTNLDPSSLAEVLVEPVLVRQQQSVCWLRNQNEYYTYGNREIEVESVEFGDENHATLIARIGEDRVLRKQGGGVVVDYGHEDYQAIYELVRIDGRWYISCFVGLEAGEPLVCKVKIADPSPCD